MKLLPTRKANVANGIKGKMDGLRDELKFKVDEARKAAPTKALATQPDAKPYIYHDTCEVVRSKVRGLLQKHRTNWPPIKILPPRSTVW